ncbi:hypothetical protein ACH429_22465 [Streptomyces pathocidini]|uniref:Holin n=1 Tax=Streptomyces pathocidini TaxID=1650571 RepID=A0ABW7UYY2_9ACTN|nr:hypothetical protein [Streptomyces pathocidini]
MRTPSEPTKRTLRTVLQTAVGLALALPAIIDATGLPTTLPWVASALAVSGGLARAMALPTLQPLLPSWLRTAPESGDRTALGTGRTGSTDA